MNENEIKIGSIGKIVQGEAQGYFLLVKEDFDESGGFLILISKDPKMAKNVEGYDYWAENINDIANLFKAYNWKVEWL